MKGNVEGKFGTIGLDRIPTLIKIEDMPWGQQCINEIGWLIANLEDPGSVLEVGTAEGRTMRMFGEILKPNSIYRCIDIEKNPEWEKNANYLRDAGHDVQIAVGDSSSKEAEYWARQWAPYDLVFIDGDHSYEGVKRDFELYAPMGKVIALHDINHDDEGESGREFGVKRFWLELKRKKGFVIYEHCIAGHYMGMGVIMPVKIIEIDRKSNPEKYA